METTEITTMVKLPRVSLSSTALENLKYGALNPHLKGTGATTEIPYSKFGFYFYSIFLFETGPYSIALAIL